MPIHNYICEAGHVEMDVYFTRARGGAETARACPDCGKASSIHFGSFGAYNRLMTTKGHNQSVPDPQTGLFYAHATDKKQKLRELGLEEGNPITANQAEADTWDAHNREAALKAERRQAPPILSADSEEELKQMVDWANVDIKESGDLNREIHDGATF